MLLYHYQESYDYIFLWFCSDYFQVFNKPSPNNLAYTGGRLELHIDQPFLTNCPKVLILDLISNCKCAFLLCNSVKPRLHTRRKPANRGERLGCYTLAAFLFVLSQLLARASSSLVGSQSGDRNRQSTSYLQICACQSSTYFGIRQFEHSRE